MADRYWVGGTGTWATGSTANWATTSGGSGGASVPTSADNVFFDANSGSGTITLGVSGGACLNFNCTGFAATFTGTSQTLSVFGSLTLAAGMTLSGTINFDLQAASGTYTITTAGKTVSSINFGTAATTATWSLGDALTVTNALTVSRGTFTTNNFAISAGSIASSNSNVRAINLGSSTLTLSSTAPWNTNSTQNLTFNAGTSTINATNSTTPTFTGGGLTFYNVNFTGGGTQTIALTGANTFNNLSVTATASGVKTVAFSNNQTINGSLTTSGTTTTQRIQFGSDVAGTQRTLSVATIGTLTYTQWQDIALTGAASPWTAPIGVVDLGNNTGITFDTTTLYWVGGAGAWSDATHWSTSSGGAGGAGVPGSTNNVRIDANSGSGTLTGNSANPPNYCKDFDSSGSSIATNTTVYPLIYGNFKGRSGVTNTFQGMIFYGSGSFTIDPNGATAMAAGGGFSLGGSASYTLMNNWVSSNVFSVQGTTSLNTNGYSLSGNTFAVGASATALTLGASTLTFSLSMDFSPAGYTFNAGTSTINCGTTFNAGTGRTFYNVSLTSTTALTTISGANTYNNLTFQTPASSSSFTGATFNGNQTVNGTLTAVGANGNQRIVFRSLDYITQYTITAAAVSLTDVNFTKINGAGTATWSGTRLSNGGGNSGITFDTPKTVYWSLVAGGNMLTNTGWATSSGGTPATTNLPLGQDTAIVENTGLNSGATLSISSVAFILPNLTFSTRTLPVTLAISSLLICNGSLTFNSNVTSSGAQNINVTGNSTFTSNGFSQTNSINAYGTITIADTYTGSGGLASAVGGTITLNANATDTAYASFAGTTNLNTYTLTSKTCTLSAGSTTNFGTGKIVLTGNATTIFTGNATQTVTGTPVVECNYSGATGTRTISPSTPTEANTVSFKITSGSDTVVVTSSILDLNFTGFGGTFSASARSIYGNLTLSTGMTLSAGSGSIITTFAATSGTKTITTNGKTLDFPLTFNGVGGTWQLQDNFTLGSTRTLTHTNGTIDLNGKTMNVGDSYLTAVGTKNITFNGGTLVCPGTSVAFRNIQSTNFTTTAGTGSGKISMTSSTAKTFTGGGSTYNCTLENAGSGSLTVTGSNTFTTISNSVQPTSFLFDGATTTTVTNFNVSGTSGNIVTIGAPGASNHTLSKSSGIVDVSYCTISRSTATGGATWKAYTSNGNVDGGNNSGWLFAAPSTGSGLFFGSNF